MKIAAIDIGSNSVHMVIVDVASSGAITVLDREKEMIKLGAVVFEHGYFPPDTIEMAVRTIASFRTLADRAGVDDIHVVATAATREAANGAELLTAIEEQTALHPRVISGAEEARLIWLAVRNTIELGDRVALIIDIGGGSVEMILATKNEILQVESMKLGVQRLRRVVDEYAAKQKRDLTPDLIRQCIRREALKLAEPILRAVRENGFDLAIGTSGTILALGDQVRSRRPKSTDTARISRTGEVVRRRELRAITEELLPLTTKEREARSGIDAKRADTIHLGGALLDTLLEEAGANDLTLCASSLREGIVLDAIQRDPDSPALAAEVPDLRRRSIMSLARRWDQTDAHPRHIALLALAIFDGTAVIHRLESDVRELLEYTALIHDVGNAVAFERHEEHSHYLISNTELRGFSDREKQIIALAARYHRKGKPKKGEKYFDSLATPDQDAVRLLAAILRLCEGLDRSHYQAIRQLDVHVASDAVTITAHAFDDSEIELWSAQSRTKPLARIFDRPVKVELAPDPERDAIRVSSRYRRVDLSKLTPDIAADDEDE